MVIFNYYFSFRFDGIYNLRNNTNAAQRRVKKNHNIRRPYERSLVVLRVHTTDRVKDVFICISDWVVTFNRIYADDISEFWKER